MTCGVTNIDARTDAMTRTRGWAPACTEVVPRSICNYVGILRGRAVEVGFKNLRF